jgi:hypothetical protein
MPLSKRLSVFAATTVISAGVLVGAAAVPAMATPNFCGGDVCANEAGQSLSTLYIHTWAFTTTFTGHFELQTPTGAVHNSSDKKNYAGGAGPTFALPIVYGYYCATAWRKNGPGNYTDLGEVCFVSGS